MSLQILSKNLYISALITVNAGLLSGRLLSSVFDATMPKKIPFRKFVLGIIDSAPIALLFYTRNFQDWSKLAKLYGKILFTIDNLGLSIILLYVRIFLRDPLEELCNNAQTTSFYGITKNITELVLPISEPPIVYRSFTKV